MGKTFMDGADIRESASGTDDGEGRAWPSAKEEQPGIAPPQVVINLAPSRHGVYHLVDVAHASAGVYIINVSSI